MGGKVKNRGKFTPTADELCPQPPVPPVKKTKEVIERLEHYLRLGVSIRGSAAAAGVGEGTIWDWMSRDPGFKERVNRACAESEATLVQLAVNGAAKDGRVALMMLERRFPADWSRVDRIDLKGSIQTVAVNITQEDFKRIQGQAKKLAAEKVVDVEALSAPREGSARAKALPARSSPGKQEAKQNQTEPASTESTQTIDKEGEDK